MSAATAEAPNSQPVYHPNRPNVVKQFVDENNKHDFVAWVNALRDIYARIEQTELKVSGKWKKADWDKLGLHMQQLRYMENECRKFALKRNQYGALEATT